MAAKHGIVLFSSYEPDRLKLIVRAKELYGFGSAGGHPMTVPMRPPAVALTPTSDLFLFEEDLKFLQEATTAWAQHRFWPNVKGS